MLYGYIRVSTDKQTTENQRFELLKYADEKKLHIDRWIEETVSSTRRLADRKLGILLEEMHAGDALLLRALPPWPFPHGGYEHPAQPHGEKCQSLHRQRTL
jgi:putative DNA-invertase from lambdoid prophage Rac